MNISPQTKIGWIGTGVMGVSMCGHLMDRGYATTVFNRTRAKAQPLLDRGATWADSPKAVAQICGVVFTMVGFPADVREVYFGDNGILAGLEECGNLLPRIHSSCGNPFPHPSQDRAIQDQGSLLPSILVDMTTTQPRLACEIAEAAAAKGAKTLDAPVSGGDVGAKNAALSIMVGGDEATFEAVRPLFEAMGKNIVYQGGPGSGQHTKMCNQIVIAGTMIGVCESLLYGSKAGLNLETMLQSISGGAAGCWTLTNLAPRILNRNFDPGFFVEHFIKDMGIALDEAKRMNLTLPGLTLAHQLYKAVQSQGHGRKGTHALMLALEQMQAASVK